MKPYHLLTSGVKVHLILYGHLHFFRRLTDCRNSPQNSRMFHQKEGQSSKQRLWTFSVLIFHHTVALLLLTHCSEGHPQVIGPAEPIVAFVGDDIILPCTLEPAMDASSTTVEWTRPDLKPRFVHLWRSGQELLDDQHPSYVGRTSLFIDKFKHGDVSLKLSKVKVSDRGTYRCYMPIYERDATVELVFGSVSSPEIVISKVSHGVLLDCKSKGWYLEPEVLWLDSEGNFLSTGPTETVRGPGGLYTVSSRVTVGRRRRNSFTCRVQQKNINHIRETQIQIPVDLFMVQSSPAIRITICVAVCIMSVGAVSLIVWKGRQNKIRTTNNINELQLLMEGERDRVRLMTEREKMRYLENTKAKLDEELQKTEGELQHVQQVIKTLTEQKEDLNNQRVKLISLQQEEMMKIEEKIKDLDKTRITGKNKKLEKHEKNLHDLEKKKTENKELLENTDKLLKTTEDLIIKMTERKAKLERDVEQINKNLKETKRQIEESQRKPETERQREESQSVQFEQSEREEERNDPSSNDPQ